MPPTPPSLLRARALAWLLIAASVWTPAPVAVAQVQLPALGETAAEDFGVGTERRLGEQIMRDIRRDPDYLEDPLLLDYLRSLWEPLVAAARQRGDVSPETDGSFAWEAFLVRDRSVNAFALPGGYVGVHLGLIALTATRDELASVLAHELSHVTQRHIARSVSNAQRQGIIGLAAMLLGVIVASRAGSADVANAAIAGGQAAAAQGQLNFSRDMEREADRIGFGLMAGAGFAPAGMASMFDRLDTANRLNDSNAFPYLRSHPLTVERLAEARSRTLGDAGTRAAAGAQATLHLLYQAHARVLMDTDPPTLRRLQDVAGGGGADRLATLYAASLAASLLRDHAAAVAHADEALRLARRGANAAPSSVERALVLLAARVRLARGEAGDAAAVLSLLSALPAGAAERGPMFLRTQAALGLQREGGGTAGLEVRRATEALQTWVSDHRGDAAAWSLLAQSAQAAGLPLRALRADAEAAAARGDLNGAIDRLRSAQATLQRGRPVEEIEAAVIDARLRELQAQRRLLAAEARGARGP